MFAVLLPFLLGCAHHEPAAATPHEASARSSQFSSVYSLDSAAALTAPAGLADAMREFYDPRVLIGIGRGAGDTTTVLLAVATEDGRSQDLCYETTEWPAVKAGPDGALSVEGRALVFGADGTRGTLAGISMSAQRTPDGLTISSLTGLMDTRPLVSRMGNNLAPDAFCSFLPAFGPCVECPDGTGAACWTLTLTDAVATPVEATLEARDRSAICADPACAASCAPSGG